ncbi:hypothetical protein KRE40_13445 [Elizabethkingia meningoseptica]|uniref:Uncharacterized protein n=1 Tax=Elizabethkingia meningoseptica TaxID=238 RepID=A0A1V3TZF7_ELIME|nr:MULTISPECIES: hypothetical protein [Elizabethkingia]AQX10883.1 hypothetical protein BBD35_00175 [Elizabethkingia meningoseptica]EJK5328237.1 hypothetical protein [Elizabethkingia meningoseptica]MBG0512200.1 hypothetical protein [Elizabethkingia meningoseptica]MCL1674314.1 hypothetical protein [Elizabethkingia meningoseptica]MCL1686065.1 hypothetical protein [Elizabethkingia meningoseptica]
MKMEQIQKKYGDYQLLGEMLGVSSDAAKMRYRRKDSQAIKAMQAIYDNRRKLVESFRAKAERR